MHVHPVRRSLVIAAVFGAAALTAPLFAQYAQAPVAPETYGQPRSWDDEVPAHISFVEGSVTLEREGRLEPAEANVALLSGDRLRTRGGRVEILFADGSALYLDEQTTLDMLSGSLTRLLSGQIRLSIARSADELEYRIDAPAASVWIRTAGEYRINVGEGRRRESEVDLAVIRGSAELVNEHGRTLVRAGTYAVATADLAPSRPYVENSAHSDEFDDWIDRQRGARLGTYSTRYLPTELRYYSGAFDNYGSWDYLPSHGYVWYPRVASGWRPYHQGRWSFTGHFGWFWVGIDRWSWATHHYGRWGVNAGSWYWIPERRWSPAWVSWGTAPGYVSWCPLGYDGRPVYSFRHADPWNAWTILPRQAFVPNVWVTKHIVVHNTIVPTVRQQFIERSTAPVVAGIAVARATPIQAPTNSRGWAVPRNGRAAYDGEEAWRSGVVAPAAQRSAGASSRASSNTSGGVAPGVARPGSAAGAATSRDGRFAAQTDGRSATQPETNAQRATPERSRIPPGSRTVEVPRVESPRIEVPRATAPRVEAPRGTEPDYNARRAVPRSAPATQSNDEPPARFGSANSRAARPSVESPRPSAPSVPTGRSEQYREPSRAPERAAPRESAPRFGGESPRQSAPAQRAEEPRAPSRIPDRAAPRESAPPPSAAPPPSRGRGSDAGASSAPPSRGGGDPKAVPRGRGGGV